MRLRPAAIGDVDAVLELWVRAQADPSSTDDAESLRQLVEHDPGALVVAEIDGKIMGSLIAGWDGWRGNMYRLAVDPDQRRRGVARALVETGEERLRNLGARRVSAGVPGAREVATATWSELGYAFDPAMSRYVKDLPRTNP